MTSSSSQPTPSRPYRRAFSNAGIHEVEAPKLGRPDSTPPPPPPVVRQHIPEVRSNGFKPFYTTRRPANSRRRTTVTPKSLDYGTDIITIYDLDKSKNHQINNNTWVRTVGSTLQVKPDNAKPQTTRGRVYDDVIYDYAASSGDSFKPQETIIDVRRLKNPSGSDANGNSWRKLTSSVVYRVNWVNQNESQDSRVFLLSWRNSVLPNITSTCDSPKLSWVMLFVFLGSLTDTEWTFFKSQM